MTRLQIRPIQNRKQVCDPIRFIKAMNLKPQDEKEVLDDLRPLILNKVDESNVQLLYYLLMPKDNGEATSSRLDDLPSGTVTGKSSLDPPGIEALVQWWEALAKTQYEIIIQNSADDDITNLEITYYQNQLVRGKVVRTGPYVKGPLQDLPPGQTAGFQTGPCLAMADNYTVSFDYQGEPNSMTENIPDLNQKEEEMFGSIDFCGDSLEIFLE